MRKAVAPLYRCPESGSELTVEVERSEGADLIDGVLVSANGNRYAIRGGIPDFTFPFALPEPDARARDFYDSRVEDYDRYLPLTFQTFGEKEDEVREDMVSRLHLSEGSQVLEIGAGTGRDSIHIARRIPRGTLFCQDIAPKMLAALKRRLEGVRPVVEIAVANASYLPFPDDTFDAVFQFGGVGEFGDIGRFFREVVRVTRPGGRVVVGDESMPVWLRKTEFAKVLTFTNQQFNAPLPLEHLPIQARAVNLRWIIGGTFYLIDFTVGVGLPPADLEFGIPGPRGGTHMTRYYGQLEGVTPQTKALAHEARERRNVSMHDWLDAVVREAALEQLGGGADEP
jgi:ubiquinone/menaquinone biosynthesis C-methylase UbiE